MREHPPGWRDNVPRRLQYEARHPEVKIRFYGGFFRAIVPGLPEPIIHHDLGRLIDALEALDEVDPAAGEEAGGQRPSGG